MSVEPLGGWATPHDAAEHFAAKLSYEKDVSDVAGAMGRRDILVVDVRSADAWAAGHLPGATHLPHALIAEAALPADVHVVTYCWGPACNGATRGALAFARRGYAVKEMIGGFEYWVREGLEVETSGGPLRRAPDPLTVVPLSDCAC